MSDLPAVEFDPDEDELLPYPGEGFKHGELMGGQTRRRRLLRAGIEPWEFWQWHTARRARRSGGAE